MHSFFWLYLKIKAPDFRLIPLDCNTLYVQMEIYKVTYRNRTKVPFLFLEKYDSRVSI